MIHYAHQHGPTTPQQPELVLEQRQHHNITKLMFALFGWSSRSLRKEKIGEGQWVYAVRSDDDSLPQSKSCMDKFLTPPLSLNTLCWTGLLSRSYKWSMSVNCKQFIAATFKLIYKSYRDNGQISITLLRLCDDVRSWAIKGQMLTLIACTVYIVYREAVYPPSASAALGRWSWISVR